MIEMVIRATHADSTRSQNHVALKILRSDCYGDLMTFSSSRFFSTLTRSLNGQRTADGIIFYGS